MFKQNSSREWLLIKIDKVKDIQQVSGKNTIDSGTNPSRSLPTQIIVEVKRICFVTRKPLKHEKIHKDRQSKPKIFINLCHKDQCW